MNEIPKTWKEANVKYHYIKTIDLEGTDYLVSKFWTKKHKRWIYRLEKKSSAIIAINYWLKNA